MKGFSKYGAKKTPCRYGCMHDSVKEAVRCNELHLLLAGKKIENLELQKTFLIIPAIQHTETLDEVYTRGEHKGEHKTKIVIEEQAAVYKADFVYFDKDLGKTVIEDTKGMKTKEYILKRKLMKQLYCNDGSTIFLES